MLLLLFFCGLAAAADGHLTYRLQNVVNEFDLLIKNQRADQADLRRQKREMEILRVFERIPYTSDLGGLRQQLEASARESEIRIVGLEVRGRSRDPGGVPTRVPSDGARFEFSEAQLLEILFLEIRIEGKKDKVSSWIASLLDHQLRLVRAEQKALKRLPSGRWVLSAQAFRFRTVVFPTIIPVDPRQIVAQAAPQVANDPIVKDLIARAMAQRGQVLPLYRGRGEFLLNGARMRLFAEKTAE